jgi:Plasmid encoded RepA protein
VTFPEGLWGDSADARTRERAAGAASERTVAEITAEVLGQEFEEAKSAGELGYYARILTQATLPHSRPSDPIVTRQNGALTLRMAALGPGLPYGGIPRVLLAWVTTEAVRSRQRELVLGDHLASFMRQLDLVPTGGRWGSIPRLHTQMVRLFSTAIGVTFDSPNESSGAGWVVADQYRFWWDPKSPDQADLWQSTVTLGERFYEMVVDRPVPVDMRALRALRRSPLALDLYTWLTYRYSYLKKPTTIPWPALQAQFGADYARQRAFRSKVIAALTKVVAVYGDARLEAELHGLTLRPSPPHVARLRH